MKSHELKEQFTTPLLSWYDKNGRKNLPWQLNKEPYNIWISEIMLQQTQVQTVISYYNTFIQRYPNVHILASATIDQVLSLWSGLGYYSRARNIHKTAQIISQNCQGQFPKTHKALLELPGIGPSTASAICSLAYNQHTAIMDGNVKRVLARFFSINGDLNQAVIKKNIQNFAHQCMCSSSCADYTQAIMDLGALCCTFKKPSCSYCPLRNHCSAFNNNSVHLFPEKKSKLKKKEKAFKMLVFQEPGGQILLKKRASTGIWAGLWAFPTFEDLDIYSLEKDLPPIGLKIAQLKKPFHIKHTLTHLILNIEAYYIELAIPKELNKGEDYQWYQREDILNLGIPKPVRDILNSVL